MCWRRKWQPTAVLLPGKSHGRRSLVGCSPWGREESDMTEWLHFHFQLSCIGEGNGNPLQCSCVENLRDGGAWWAAIYGVAESRARLKWLSSSSSSFLGDFSEQSMVYVLAKGDGCNCIINKNIIYIMRKIEESEYNQDFLCVLTISLIEKRHLNPK